MNLANHDVLGDAAGLAVGDGGCVLVLLQLVLGGVAGPEVVQQGGLAVVHVAEDGDDGGPPGGVGRVVDGLRDEVVRGIMLVKDVGVDVVVDVVCGCGCGCVASGCVAS